MRIGAPQTTRTGGRTRAQAMIAWEDSDLPPQTVLFDVPEGFASFVPADAFVAAAAVPATIRGERRIAVEGAVCPVLRDGISAAAGLLRSWYRGVGPAPRLEPEAGFVAPRPCRPSRAAIFASGGVDSLFSILQNRRELPLDHPRSFRDAIRIRDLMYPVDSSPERRAHIETRSKRAVQMVSAAAGLDVIEVATNAFALETDFEAYARWTHGSVLGAVAIALSGGVTDATISASHDIQTALRPWGSHPLLDPLFGNAAVTIHHEGIESSRLEKTAAVGRWEPGLAALYVCEAGPFEGVAVNCGRCEKCVRTRVGLLVGAGIEEPPTFASGPVSPADIDALPLLAGFRLLTYYWTELAQPARESGRPELAAAIDRLIARQHRLERWRSGRGWREAIRRFDERTLGGTLIRLRRRLRTR